MASVLKPKIEEARTSEDAANHVAAFLAERLSTDDLDALVTFIEEDAHEDLFRALGGQLEQREANELADTVREPNRVASEALIPDWYSMTDVSRIGSEYGIEYRGPGIYVCQSPGVPSAILVIAAEREHPDHVVKRARVACYDPCTPEDIKRAFRELADLPVFNG